MIKFDNVSKMYGDKAAVDQISFEVQEGEFFVLIGPSGCGKTTTLKMINRLIPLTSGYIYFKEQPISSYKLDEMRWNIGYVLQQIALFPHMTVRDNIAQVPLMKKWKTGTIDDQVNRLLDMVGLPHAQFRDRYPSELSGGQQQRIGVVRALAADPPVILMDEPFSALDPISREKLQDDLLRLQSEINKTIIFVTHDINEAFKLGDRICLMNQGRIEQIGTPREFVESPKSKFVTSFIGKTDIERLARDCVTKLPFDGRYPTVDAETPVSALYSLLAEHEQLNVTGADYLGAVTRPSVFEVLSKGGTV
ncbi:ABC transporter ATP-binding protein [Macrococcus carouselicus]|uniref:Carnitine transport ATP-binding protein OpuCA n=1 Tax=Macrococcus carouselicus TaxID=69969 RepID=A0A9Q8FMH9_9STAP|nr:ABC transporter ATP-binding protein [Macrococcus carouselicus]TDM03650.1 ABC transporter ATP-binding protein [Macrococcus carouselicus]